MRNYLGRLRLTRKANQAQIDAAIKLALNDTNDKQATVDAEAILSKKVTRTYYERTHLQYEAISAALSCLHSATATDTHRWSERAVEFQTNKASTLEQ